LLIEAPFTFSEEFEFMPFIPSGPPGEDAGGPPKGGGPEEGDEDPSRGPIFLNVCQTVS